MMGCVAIATRYAKFNASCKDAFDRINEVKQNYLILGSQGISKEEQELLSKASNLLLQMYTNTMQYNAEEACRKYLNNEE